jgi:serine/threonine protein kinase
MGVVYEAEDKRLGGRHCAIKEFSPEHLPLQDRAWAVQTFQQEAAILSQLSHPGLTNVTDYFAEGSNEYLVMELIEGGTLADQLDRARSGRLPQVEALDITRQLCGVLEYLHRRTPPIVFRDLKPANIMLTSQGQVKLIDFGIARLFKPGQAHDTISLGTPGYAAPEQYGGQGQTDPRSDIYSLGVVLHQMLTGYDPARTPFNLPLTRTLNGTVPPNIEAVIRKAVQVDPNQRFQMIAELRAKLSGTNQRRLPLRTGLLIAIGLALALACVRVLMLLGNGLTASAIVPPTPTSLAVALEEPSLTPKATATPTPSITPTASATRKPTSTPRTVTVTGAVPPTATETSTPKATATPKPTRTRVTGTPTTAGAASVTTPTEAGSGAPTPTSQTTRTSTPPPLPGGIGRILFTTDLGGLFLYSVDPAGGKPTEIGRTDKAHSTCGGSVSTADGAALATYRGPYCALARLGECASPNGKWEAVYSAKGRADGSGTITVRPIGDDSQARFVFDGMVNAAQGIRWAPDDSSRFIFYVGGNYYAAQPSQDGFVPIGNGKVLSWSPDSMMLLIEGINDIGIQRLDGSPLQ